MSNKDGKSSINVKRLTMWSLISDSESGTVYGDSPRAFTNQLNSIRYTPTVQTAEQYGDGIKVEDYVAKDGGSDEVVIRGFTDGDHEFLFGETENANGVTTSGSDDIVPYVAVAWATERPDGKYNLYKQYKVKFMPQGEDSKQREGSSISFGTASLKGTYSPRLSDHKDMSKRFGVDPKADKDFIENWFSDADYIGEAESTQSAGNADNGVSARSLEKAVDETEALPADDEGE